MKTEKVVTREEFVNHIASIARKETKVPATIYLADNAIERSNGENRGRGTISFFRDIGKMDFAGKPFQYDVPTINDTARGARVSFFPPEIRGDLWDGLMRIFDEEESIAEKLGKSIQYTIGAKNDRFARKLSE